jgi:hypothetical protein
MPNRLSRAKFAKLVKESKPGSFRPTINDVVFWYDNLNELVFENQLPRLTGVTFRQSKKHWAEVTCYKYKRTKELRSEVMLSNHFMSMKHFVEVVAHEMVHIWEYDNFHVITHGERFFAWSPKLKRLGLELTISQ